MGKSLSVLCLSILAVLLCLISCHDNNNSKDHTLEDTGTGVLIMQLPESIITRENQKKVYFYMPLNDLLSMFNNAEYVERDGFGTLSYRFMDENGASITIDTTKAYPLANNKVLSCVIFYEGERYFLLDYLGLDETTEIEALP